MLALPLVGQRGARRPFARHCYPRPPNNENKMHKIGKYDYTSGINVPVVGGIRYILLY